MSEITLSELMKGLNIETYPAFVNKIYAVSQEKYYDGGLWYLEEDFLKQCHEKYNFFGEYAEDILKAARLIKEDELLCRFLALLRYIVSDCKDEAVDMLNRLPLPKITREEDRFKTEMMPFFTFPPEADNIYNFMTQKGFPEKSLDTALHNFYHSIGGFKGRFGRVGFEKLYFVWGMHFVECKILTVGSLEFELKKFIGPVEYFVDKNGNYVMLAEGITFHKDGNRLNNAGFTDNEGSFKAHFVETDTYYEGVKIENCLAVNKRVRLYKSEWKRVLKPGDNIINVHIPSRADLSDEALEKTFREGEELILNAFPEYNAKAFVCLSWLMEPELENMVKPGSKIVGFQKRFMRFPVPSSGKEIFIFLFKGEPEDYNTLPENTTLERAAKQYYLDGKFINKFGGAFFSEHQQKMINKE